MELDLLGFRFGWQIPCLTKHFLVVFLLSLERFWLRMSTNWRFVRPADDPNAKYTLVGVVVHKGSADAGHYYSFIQDRNSQKWLRFDDKTITDFDPKVKSPLLPSPLDWSDTTHGPHLHDGSEFPFLNKTLLAGSLVSCVYGPASLCLVLSWD